MFLDKSEKAIHTLIMTIKAARIIKHRLASFLIHRHVPMPEIAVHQDGLDPPPARLHRTDETRDDLFQDLL